MNPYCFTGFGQTPKLHFLPTPMRLLTLAVIPALAASAHAITLDIQGGFGDANRFDHDGTYAASLGFPISDEVSLSATYLYSNLDTANDSVFGTVNSSLKTITADLTYDLSNGGLGAFVGIGAGQARLSGVDFDGSNGTNEFCAAVFVGTRFEVAKNVDFTLTARYTRVFGVYENFGAASEQDIGHWAGLAGIRFKF